MELGVVFPIANGGQVMSKISPHPMPRFALHRAMAEKAEAYGFGYGLAQVTLRGFGGATSHWDYQIDSLGLMAGLGAVTEKMRLIGSVALPTMHPAMTAKMCIAINDISGGRFDLNLVTGWNRSQYAQMGLWPGDEYYQLRYDYAEEYATVLRELWDTGYSNFKGRFYQLDDCQLGWTTNEPIGLICAGQSPRGMQFTAKYGDYAYVLGATADAAGIASTCEQFRRYAADEGREVQALTVVIVIIADTDEAAEAQSAAYVDNADVEAITEMQRQAGLDVSEGTSGRIVDVANSTFQNIPRIAGSPATVAEYFDSLAAVDSLHGVMIIFAEPVEGLDRFGRDVMPLMRSVAKAG